MDPIAGIAWIVSFVIVTVVVTGLSRRIGWSAPVALVAVGALVSFFPGIPQIEIDPDLILYGLLPPLLFAAAIRTSLIDVRARGDSILLLSVVLVGFTVLVAGLTTWLVVPAITLAAAFAFGAVVAPTDAVAVTAIAGRVGLPRRAVTVLEGESLLNDATALVALNASLAAVVSVVTPLEIAGDFVMAVAGGVAVGFAVGFTMATVRKFVHAPVLDTSLSLVTPFVAFLVAEVIHGSGVLAVVVAGLYLGYRSPSIQSAEARIAESVNWRTIQFLLENAVFLFIGLNLAGILNRALRGGPGLWQTVFICVAIFLALGAARFTWVTVATIVYRRGPARLRERGWNWGTSIVVSFAGIRGVVTLAAVFLLPAEIPNREFLQFLAFVVVVGSLVAGLALPWIIRRLNLPSPDLAQEAVETQRLMAEAQTAGVLRLEEELSEDDEERVIHRLRTNAGFLADALERPSDGDEPLPATYRRLRRLMLAAERDAVITARAERRYQEHAVRAALASIDAEETALKASAPKKPGAELT